MIVTPLLGLGAPAAPMPAVRTVTYHGLTVRIPRSWPVYRLDRAPGTCVRFDRHALYLGTPGPRQACPAGLVGRTEAILLEPLKGTGAPERDASVVPTAASTSFPVPSDEVNVTATWGRERWLIDRALGRTTLPAAPARHPEITGGGYRQAAGAQSSAPSYYTGRGFDACSAPSSQTMSAWSSSYHAIGIYIGGVNAACSQTNLTPDWVSQQIAAGWHLVPTYVGLQAPSNGCGCASMTPSQAAAQGSAAASDAVSQMQALGLPAGNPIYFDMEGYSRTSNNTSAVLNFLAAWTSQLHADGYASGVYSSVSSGIADLASQWGTSYPEPDDVWFADWNGQQTTSSSSIPASDWSSHQRLHQYQGGHNETHGGVTINIDSDYLDGAAAGSVAAPAQVPPPTMSISPQVDGTTALRMSWPGGSGLSAWQVLGGSTSSGLVALAKVAANGGANTQLTFRGTERYFQAQALGSGGQVLASSSAGSTPTHVMTFGRSAFVSLANGTAGLPAGCYTGSTCHLATTITAGRTTLAHTGAEAVGANGAGLLFFKLDGTGLRMLQRARGSTLAVRVTVRDGSGASATSALNLVGFATSGRPPRRASSAAGSLRVVGLTAFISPGGVGGALTDCLSPAPCSVTARLSVAGSTVAQTGHELIGANELVYVSFKLTPRGMTLLQHTPGNQLGARVTVTQGTSSAGAAIALTRF